MGAIAPKIGCKPETLRSWVRQAERDAGRREGTNTTERERIKALERENRELKQANEILCSSGGGHFRAGRSAWGGGQDLTTRSHRRAAVILGPVQGTEEERERMTGNRGRTLSVAAAACSARRAAGGDDA
ncbi:hypothetical protein CR157_14040 [Halomonas sp. LBP4]|nr:hypothetical protein CR157_14040 [Halomonas sp. LBP4]